jgi:hypothetical protein
MLYKRDSGGGRGTGYEGGPLPRSAYWGNSAAQVEVEEQRKGGR